jgi:hypothetical protein
MVRPESNWYEEGLVASAQWFQTKTTFSVRFFVFFSSNNPSQRQSSRLLTVLNYLFIQRQKEQFHAKIIQLEKQLNVKQKLELEIQQLKGKLNVMKHMEDEGDFDVLDMMDALHLDLREKEQSLRDMDALNQTLIIKERKSNDELQEARKELISVIFYFF